MFFQVTEVLSQLLDIWLEKVSTYGKLINRRFSVKRPLLRNILS